MAQFAGVIQSVSPEEIKVLVSVEASDEEVCGACALYDSCKSTGKKAQSGQDRDGAKRDRSSRILTVYDFPIGLNPGDHVTLEEAPGLPLKGAFFAFVIPLFLLIFTAVFLSQYGISEGVIAGLLLGLLLLYGLVLFGMRDRLKKILYYKVSSVASDSDGVCRDHTKQNV